MKIFGIFLLLFLLTMLFNIMMDMIIGLSLRNSLRNLYNPFWVKGGPELATTLVLIFIWLVPVVFSYIRTNKNKDSKKNKP